MNKRTYFTQIGILFGLFAVLLGAFGAHGLKTHLTEHGSTQTWQTAVDYQMWHALALLLWTALIAPDQKRALTGYCFTAGILLFSGSLYWLSLDGPSWLGPVPPVGGLLLMAGWATMFLSTLRSK